MMSRTEIVSRGKSAFVDGFELFDVKLLNDIMLRVAMGGGGDKTPLLMVHGHPHTHVIWRKVAPAIAQDRKVILVDLRGYGDSTKPESTPDHRPYSKREVARDLQLLLQSLGIEQCDFVGHDRGGRVGHRFALDWPELVRKAVFIDIAPTATMYERTDKEFASRYFWWFFLIQPEPFPEKLINFDPEYFLRHHIKGQLKIEGTLEENVFQEYLRSYRNPETIHAICEDYRAAATIDLADDKADADKRIEAPLHLLWGARGTVGKLYDVVQTWRDKATVVTGRALDCGHSPQEECPQEFLREIRLFLDGKE